MFAHPCVFSNSWHSGHQHDLKASIIVGGIIGICPLAMEIEKAAMSAGKLAWLLVALKFTAKLSKQLYTLQQFLLILTDSSSDICLSQQSQVFHLHTLAGFKYSTLR